MTSKLFKTFISLFLVMNFLSFASAQEVRTISNIDADWKFHLGDIENGQDPVLNDASWRSLNVPHDWSIEGEYDREHPTGRGGGYLPAGIGWYRKQIIIPQSDAGKKIFIEFEGVMANSDVWVNGQHLGKRPFGYATFSYDLTGKLRYGNNQPNIIAVRVDNSLQPASRWYAGAGIYRHVHLITVNPVYLEQWGVFITTPEITPAKATVKVQASVANATDKAENLTVQTTVTGPDGKSFSSPRTPLSVAAGSKANCTQEIAVTDPKIWDVEHPNLYNAVTIVRSGNTVVDDQVNTIGIREFHFDAATGFYLNGKNMKLLGVCLHHDGGPVGAAVPAAVWERRFKVLKDIGVNAIRTAHNPMDPTFYRLCNEMGFLVMDETFDTWTAAKPNGTQGYNLYFNEWWEADTRDMVLRDRNHPSIVIYSVGNEIRDPLNTEVGRNRFLMQRDLIHQLDPTRPVTLALFRPNQMQVYDNGFAELMDVVGQNYRESELVAAWEAKPDRKVLGTENGHGIGEWRILRDKPYMSGQFLWTGIDYLGEANWPEISWSAALLDRNAFFKPTGYQRQSWWSPNPMVKMVRHDDNSGKGPLVLDWTPADFGTYDEGHVYVYSNCDEVELFLNGVSEGKQPINADASPLFWNIGFNPGTLKAVGYKNGTQVAVDEMVTAGEPVKVLLTAERSSVQNTWDDLVYVKATIVDKDGRRNPNLNPKLTFTISGPGIINAVDNGNITSHEKYKTNERTSYRGEAVALIQATGNSGKITLNVSAEGLEGSSITLDAVPAP